MQANGLEKYSLNLSWAGWETHWSGIVMMNVVKMEVVEQPLVENSDESRNTWKDYN